MEHTVSGKKEAVRNSTPTGNFTWEKIIYRETTKNKTLRKSGEEPCACLVAVALQIKTNIKRETELENTSEEELYSFDTEIHVHIMPSTAKDRPKIIISRDRLTERRDGP
jgi:hypothetical protein